MCIRDRVELILLRIVKWCQLLFFFPERFLPFYKFLIRQFRSRRHLPGLPVQDKKRFKCPVKLHDKTVPGLVRISRGLIRIVTAAQIIGFHPFKQTVIHFNIPLQIV